MTNAGNGEVKAAGKPEVTEDLHVKISGASVVWWDGQGKELAHIEVSGQSGGGLVKITMTARMDLRRVQIDPQAISDDIEMLEDLITAAFNDAIARANEASQAKMGAVTAGVPLPPGMKLPF